MRRYTSDEKSKKPDELDTPATVAPSMIVDEHIIAMKAYINVKITSPQKVDIACLTK